MYGPKKNSVICAVHTLQMTGRWVSINYHHYHLLWVVAQHWTLPWSAVVAYYKCPLTWIVFYFIYKRTSSKSPACKVKSSRNEIDLQHAVVLETSTTRFLWRTYLKAFTKYTLYKQVYGYGWCHMCLACKDITNSKTCFNAGSPSAWDSNSQWSRWPTSLHDPW